MAKRLVFSGAEHADRIVKAASLATAGIELPIQYTYDQLGEIPYVNATGIMRQGCHSGQRKLLLTEIEFLSCCARQADLVVYVGSAPCEKMPVLLALFPRVRFLLVDPNFHTFAAPKPPVYVYQNVDSVSHDSVANVRRDLRLVTKKGLSDRDQKRMANARLVDRPPIYNQKYRGLMSDVNKPPHVAEMRRIQREFEAGGYRSLARDIMARMDRVYIIQDYMTEELCGRIAESIAAAGGMNICVISDLRTSFFASTPIDLDYIWNDALQLIIIKMLQPSWSMLKFHPPYMDYETSIPLIDELEAKSARHAIFDTIRHDLETVRTQYGLDLIAVYRQRDRMYKYVKNTGIWLQAWGPTATSEARLIVSRADADAPYISYSASEWDDRFTYNKLVRGYGYYGALYESIANRRDHRYDGCFDCTLEMLILLDYAFRGPRDTPGTIDVNRLVGLFKQKNAQDAVLRLQRQINNAVINTPDARCIFHGRLTRPPDVPLYYVLRDGEADDVEVMQSWYDPAADRVVSKKLEQGAGGLTPARNIEPDPADIPRFWSRVASG